MRVHSFTRQGRTLVPVEIDLTLAPGLPQIILLGLPDAGVRESAVRIRSAIRKQGFRWPKAQRVLVQMRPHDMRKSSQGLDLAIAAALLWETKQIPPAPDDATLYGSLSLDGTVEAPTDILDLDPRGSIFTGATLLRLPFPSFQLSELKDLKKPRELSIQSCESVPEFLRPQAAASQFPRAAAKLAAVIAAGEHPALICGAAGSGKTTLATSIAAWIEPPRTDTAVRAARKFSRDSSAGIWRPVVRPHHSITPLAMIGGGSSIWPGEVHRADTGLLILDELAEFHADVHEALREPTDAGFIHLARAGQQRSFAAQFCLIATSNLCECGRYVPTENTEASCRCRSVGRRRILSRLSGPLLDRFQIIAFANDWQRLGDYVSVAEIAERTTRASEFRVTSRGQKEPNALVQPGPIDASLTSFQRDHIMGDLNSASRRRVESTLRLARTFADLRLSEAISNEDLDQALRISWQGHQLLENARL